VTLEPITNSAAQDRQSTGVATAEFGSDLVVRLLADLGIEYVAFNPGATFRGLHDSLVDDGSVPIVICLHEEVSVAVAHGYTKATGRPMAVALHDVVGLQHAAMAIYNAWCDRVPILLLGSTGPIDATKRRPWIDWIHTANVQGQQVRDYVKWDDQPGSLAATAESIIRAMRLMNTEPQAPVYICTDTEHLEEPAEPARKAFELDLDRFPAPGANQPNPADLDRVARWLVEAERPVVVADLVGRSQAAFEKLVELAELLALPVIDPEGEYWKNALNFPTRHPLNLSGDQQRLVRDADVVLGLECRDLFGILSQVDADVSAAYPLTPADAKVAHVSLSHLITRSWTADFSRLQPVDVHLAAELAPTLTELLERVRVRLEAGEGDAATRERRRTELTAASAALRAGWDERAAADAEADGVTQAYLAHVLGEALAGRDPVLANGHLGNWALRLWDFDRTDQYLGGQGGGGLGYGLGASIGAALAHRDGDRLVVDLQSDGDALFTPEALWTAAEQRVPLLIVMDNNRAYFNSVKHAHRIAARRGRPIANTEIGTTIGPPFVDFAGLARSFGVEAAGPVTTPAELGPAVARAVEFVAENRLPYLLDVVTERPPAIE
jgi:thiamine pyrophosphate-dependent acetolactate synthase large subunit-like protein